MVSDKIAASKFLTCHVHIWLHQAITTLDYYSNLSKLHTCFKCVHFTNNTSHPETPKDYQLINLVTSNHSFTYLSISFEMHLNLQFCE